MGDLSSALAPSGTMLSAANVRVSLPLSFISSVSQELRATSSMFRFAHRGFAPPYTHCTLSVGNSSHG